MKTRRRRKSRFSFKLLSLVLGTLLLPAGLYQVQRLRAPASGDSALGPADRAVFVANGMQRIHSQSEYKTALLLNHALQRFKNDPDLSSYDITRELHALEDQYDRMTGIAAGGRPESLLKSQEVFLNAASVVFAGRGKTAVEGYKVAVEGTEAFVHSALEWSGRDPRVAATMATGQLEVRLRSTVTDTLQDSWDFYREDSRGFREVMDGFFVVPLGGKPSDSRSRILANNPDLRFQIEANEKLDELLGRDSVSPEDLQALQSEVQAGLAEVSVSIRALAESRAKESLGQREAELVKQRMQLQSEAEQAALFLSTQLIGIVGGEKGRQVASGLYECGKATLAVRDAIAKFQVDSQVIGSQLGALIMTGSFVQIGMTLAMSFMSGPPPEQLILEQLGQVRSDIATVREELHERFNRVDEKLDRIQATVLTGLEQLQTALAGLEQGTARTSAQVRGDLVSIQEEFRSTRELLFRMELSQGDWLKAGFHRPVSQQLRKCEKPVTRSDWQRFRLREFQECLTLLMDHGLESAGDSLSLNPAGLPYDAETLHQRLSKHPLEANLRYLVEDPLVSSFGQCRSCSSELVNPAEWALAAHSMTGLLASFENYAKTARISALSELISRGERVQRAIFDATGGRPAELLNRLLAVYREDAEALKQVLRGAAVESFALNRTHGIDPLLPVADQPEVVIPESGSLLPGCKAGAPGALPGIPSNRLGMALPRNVRLALKLPLGKATWCFQADWAEARKVFTVDPEERKRISTGIMGYPAGKEDYFGKPRLTVWVTIDGVGKVYAVEKLGPESLLYRSVKLSAHSIAGEPAKVLKDTTHFDPRDWWARQWAEVAASFASNFKGSYAEVTEQDLTGRLEERLARERRQLQVLVSDLTQGRVEGDGDIPAVQVKKIRDAWTALTADRERLESWFMLLYPEVYARNDGLRAAFQGGRALVDARLLGLAGWTQEIPLAQLSQVIDERASGLERWMDEELPRHDATPLAWMDASLARLRSRFTLLRMQRPAAEISTVVRNLHFAIDARLSSPVAR